MDRRHPRNPSARPLVLIVEGHDDTRAMYARGLSAMGFEVASANDGTEASRRAWEIRPDVIVTDWPMPDYDGSQFLQDLKRNPRTRDIPLVAVSGHIQQSVRERAERDGFAAFFPKPCPPDELAASLRQVLKGSPMDTPNADGATKRCPQCRRNTLVFTKRYPILTTTAILSRTGTDPLDGRDRLRYESAWVCQNAQCDYYQLIGER